MSEISAVGSGTVDWSKILEQLNETSGADKASGITSTYSLDGDNLVVTVSDASGNVRTSEPIALPTKTDLTNTELADFLDEVSAAADAEVEDLKALAQEVSEANGNVTASSSGTSVQSLLFDIYALINLLQEVAQKQRDNAREIRSSELTVEVTAIESQAQHQLSAARTGFIVSAALCAAQVGLMFGATALTVKGFQAGAKSGAGQELNSAKTQLKAMEAAQNQDPAVLQTQVDEIGAKLPAQGEGSRSEVDTKIAGVDKTALNHAKDDLEVKQTQLDAKKEVRNALTQQRDAEMAKGDQANQQLVDQCNQNLETLSTDITTLESQVNDAQTAYNTALTNYGAALDQAVSGYSSDYATKATTTKNAEANYIDKHSLMHPLNNSRNGDVVDAARSAQAASGKVNDYAQAKVLEAKQEVGLKPTNGDIQVKQGDVDILEHSVASDRGYRLATSGVLASGIVNQIPQMLTGTLQGIANYASAREEAQATESQATQKEAERDREETDSLFSQAQDLIDNIRNLLQAVIQAESQTNEQIINA